MDFDLAAIRLRQASKEERNAIWAPMSPRERDVVRMAYERLYGDRLALAVCAPVEREGYFPSSVAFGDFPRPPARAG
jgi:hypothetical protein